MPEDMLSSYSGIRGVFCTDGPWKLSIESVIGRIDCSEKPWYLRENLDQQLIDTNILEIIVMMTFENHFEREKRLTNPTSRG